MDFSAKSVYGFRPHLKVITLKKNAALEENN